MGLTWGLLANFSFLLSEDGAAYYQALALVLALIACLVDQRSATPVTAWAARPFGILVALHALAAVSSGLLAGSTAGAILRYACLLPAISLLLSATHRGGGADRGLRVGLTVSGLIFVAFHLYHLEPGALLDPYYRLFVYLNPNGTAFIASMTALSALGLAQRRSLPIRLAASLSVFACLVVMLATKSRTALLTFLAGLVVAAYMRFGRRVSLALIGLGVFLAVAPALTESGSRLFTQATTLYSLDDHHRSVSSGTGRYAAWDFVIRDIWLRHPLLGVGPGNHTALVDSAVDAPGAHNGILANLAEVGLLGTLPLVVVLFLALSRNRHNDQGKLIVPLLIAALVESVAEVMLFSMGNSGSLLFLLSLATLGAKRLRLSAPVAELPDRIGSAAVTGRLSPTDGY